MVFVSRLFYALRASQFHRKAIFSCCMKIRELTAFKETSKLYWLVAVLVLTALVMSPSLRNGWVSWDDPGYVEQNPLIEDLSVNGVKEMFTTPQVMGMYHPLTLVSLAIDHKIGGKNPFQYHLVNVLLHLINTGLVFWFIFLLLGRVDVAALTAVLFGVHPMHVESVAWVSERKDVLYALFFIGGLIAYLKYLNSRKFKPLLYVAAIFLLILSLLSKSMAVMFPVILLLIDYLRKRSDYGKLILEKLPFFALAILFGIVSIQTQAASGATKGVASVPFTESVFVASYGLCNYLWRFLVPVHLSCYHPFPYLLGQSPPWYIYASMVPVVGLLTWLVIRFRKNRKIIFGAAFFLSSLLPVLQLIPVGNAIFAERYTYIGYIGLFLILGHLFASLNGKQSQLTRIFQVVLLVYVLSCSVMAFARAMVWKDSMTLWEDVMKKYPGDYLAYGKRSEVYMKQGEVDMAFADLNKGIELGKQDAELYNNRGLIFQQRRQHDRAIMDFNSALSIEPEHITATLNRGVSRMNLGLNDLAFVDFNKVLEREPEHQLVYINRGINYQLVGQHHPAILDFSHVISLGYESPAIYKFRGKSYASQQNIVQANEDFTTAISLDPNDAEAYLLRAMTFHDQGKRDLAVRDAKTAEQLGMMVPIDFMNELVNADPSVSLTPPLENHHK